MCECVTSAVGNDDGFREREESGEADSETNGLYGWIPPNLRSPPHFDRETPPRRPTPPSAIAGKIKLLFTLCLSF